MKSSPPSSSAGGSDDRGERSSRRSRTNLSSRSHSPGAATRGSRVSSRGRRSRSGHSSFNHREERTSYSETQKRASLNNSDGQLRTSDAAAARSEAVNPFRRLDSLEGIPRISQLQQRERNSSTASASQRSSQSSPFKKPPLTPGSMGLSSPSGLKRGGSAGQLARKGIKSPDSSSLSSRSAHTRKTVPNVNLLNSMDDDSSSFGDDDDDSGPKRNSVWQKPRQSRPMPRRIKSGPPSHFAVMQAQAKSKMSPTGSSSRRRASMCGGSGAADVASTSTSTSPERQHSPPPPRVSAPGAISNFHSNSLRPSQFSPSSFSATSSAVARQFLHDDSNNSEMASSLVERFQQSHSTSFAKDETESSYVHDMSDSVMQYSMNVTDFEWNPESQQRQQEEWRKLQQQHPNNSAKHQSDPSSKTASQAFFQRKDLRQVDQSVNLMDQSLDNYGDPFTGTSNVERGDAHQNDNPNINKKRRGKKQKHRDSSSTSSSFFSQASNWVDEFLDERSIKSSRRKQRRRGQMAYREHSCCQDLLCSRMTIVLIIAALVGAFVAWQTGAFFSSATSSDGEEGQQQQQGVMPVDQDTAMNGNEGIATTSMEQEQEEEPETVTNLLLDLLSTDLDLKNIIIEGEVSTKEELETQGSPQNLAHHWVASLEDPTLLLTTPPVMDENQHSTALNQAMLEAYALAVLYYGGNGYLSSTYTVDDDEASFSKSIWKTHTNWLRPTPICHWFGIDCENEDDGGDDHRHHIVHLNLAHNNIKGYFPGELKILSDLRTMDLSYNGLMGTLPEDLFLNMGQLVEFSGHHNSLTGSLPTAVGRMTSLRSLQLYKNELDGPLPAELDKLTSLTVLGLHQNKFQGSIPYLAHLKELEYLLLGENRLSLHVPFEIFRLLNLVELSIDKNTLLTGTIPPEIESCRNLRKFKADNNELSGHLPDVFYHLTNLVEIRVHNNKLQGPIPAFERLSNLEIISLDHNQFTGQLQSELGLLTKLTEFRAYFNKLTGEFPPEICDLKESHALEFIAVDCSTVIECGCCDDCF